MTISFPLSTSGLRTPSFIGMRACSIVGGTRSPFTGTQQVFAHQGEWWECDARIPPMKRADAEAWIAWALALNGLEGTTLFGDPSSKTPRGTWSANPVVHDAVSARAKSMTVETGIIAAVIKQGDYFQLGSGGSARLHKVLADATANGSGVASIDFWPPLRAGYVGGTVITAVAAQGQWRLASNVREWSVGLAKIYGFEFSLKEAL